MIHMTLAELADLCNVPAPQSHAAFTGISIDTWTLTPGNVYIALKGESMDGHQFIEEAARKGAIAVLAETANPAIPLPQLVVQDTHQMLGHICKRMAQPLYPSISCSHRQQRQNHAKKTDSFHFKSSDTQRRKSSTRNTRQFQ